LEAQKTFLSLNTACTSMLLRRLSLSYVFFFSLCLQCDAYTMPSKRYGVVAGDDNDGGDDDKIYLNDTDDVGPIHIMSSTGEVKIEHRRGIRMRAGRKAHG